MYMMPEHFVCVVCVVCVCVQNLSIEHMLALGAWCMYTFCVNMQCVHSVSGECVCVWTVCWAECLPVYFGSMRSLYRYRADILNVGHLLRAALYVLAEEGQCGQLEEDVLHESTISQRC